MPLETGTYISDLNASNPVGSTDKVQTLDDHVRLIKSTILASFPGITGAVTPTHTELNFVDGVTSAIQTQLDTKAAAAALNASNLTSGTVPDARFPATLPAASGVNLTALNGTNIASGTVADARLSSNVPLKNAAATISGLYTFSAGDVVVTHASQPALRLQVSGTERAIVEYVNASTTMNVDSDGSIAFKPNNTVAATLGTSGQLTTPNLRADEIGYKGAPQVTDADDYTLVLTDAGKSIFLSGNGHTLTIPANASVAFPVGTIILLTISANGPYTVAITSDSLWLAGVGTTGSRTVAAYGQATLVKVTANGWFISGAGVS